MSSPPSIEPPVKKRKLRKGTRSCWECKRRKARCVFASLEDVTCVRCSCKGTKCVSQEDEDEALYLAKHATGTASDRRIERVEALLEQLVKREGIPNLLEKESSIIQVQHSVNHGRIDETRGVRTTPIPHGLDTTLSTTLHSLLPTQEEANLICTRCEFVPCFFQQMFTRNYLALSAAQATPSATEMAILPERNAHPVVIAQKMLFLAGLMQHASPDSMQSAIAIQPARERAEILAITAIDLVNKNDCLVRSADGLECVMLEAIYHANNGELRSAFTAVRRAMTVAQLLGIHRPIHHDIPRLDSQSPRFDPAHLWYRIVYIDRLFCLMLGLPQGSADHSMASSMAMENLSHEERLEREHCIIASRILERKESELDSWITTQNIDASLQTLASVMPSGWWFLPSLTQASSRRDTFLSTTQIVNQLFHFNLVNQLHLPYLLRTASSDEDRVQYTYSRSSCTVSSREVLHRYITLQDCSLAVYAYHVIDFFALIAAIALLLAHLDSHWQQREYDVLAHTRFTDRSMIEQALRYMRRVRSCARDHRGPAILDQLLAVEEEAYTSRSVGSGRIIHDDVDDRPFFELQIPFAGVLRISSVKICFKRVLDIEEVTSSIRTPSNHDGCQETVNGPNFDAVDMSLFPGFGTNAEETAFQGVEMAFLDSLLGNLDDGNALLSTE